MKPKFVEVNGKRYAINTSFRIAIECQEIALNDDISDYEKALAIIYKLYSDEGLNDVENHASLLELGQKYLLGGKEPNDDNETPDMDYMQDMSLIEASFMSDYKIDLENQDMHWWKFADLMNGLTEDSALNRIRYLRNYDENEIKDPKQKSQLIKQKEKVALKKKTNLTKEQQESVNRFYELTGIKRKG